MKLTHYISERYTSPQAIQLLKKQFTQNKPFPHLSLHQFFTIKPLHAVHEALLQEEFLEHDTDLYQFMQTQQDIQATQNAALKKFFAFFSSKEFIDYMSTVTGIKLNSGVDMSGFIYRKGDYLLCHDDRLEGRKIAYVVNFSDVKNHPSQMGGIKGKCLACHPTTTVVLNTSGIPEGVSPRGSLLSSEKERYSRSMNQKSGGDLALMGSQGKHPGKIVERIYPEFGMFNFFEVSKKSWHQVEEVLNKERVTLAGWLHGSFLRSQKPGKKYNGINEYH